MERNVPQKAAVVEAGVAILNTREGDHAHDRYVH
jgi:hypothetical protein